ncbi:prepilin-type N-terminal cleavage/methylation domain-containing protein [Thermodesulfobacteriota bacterium]
MDDMGTQKKAGFTLIEFIAVLMIMGILSVVIVSRWTLSDTELIGQIEVIKSHLRYAQSRAMSSSSNWYVHFETTPAQYTLYKAGDGSKHFPGETDDNMTLKPGISFTAALTAAPYVIFDYLGRPYLNSSGTLGTQIAEVTTIITSSAGNIEIKPETGFIP